MIYQDFIEIQITIPNTLSCIEVGDGVSMKPLHDNSYKPNLLSRYLLTGILIFSKMEIILLFYIPAKCDYMLDDLSHSFTGS